MMPSRTSLNPATLRRIVAAGMLAVCLLPGLPSVQAAGLSPQVYQRLTAIHALIDKGQSDAALSALHELLPGVGPRPYDRAIVLQNLAYVQAGRDRFKAAIRAFEESLALEALPETAQQQMRYNLVQLYLATDAPAKAVPLLQQWFEQADNPAAGAWLLLGNALGMLKRYREAVPALQKAIELADTPHADWYETLLAMHYELKAYRECAALLEQMLRLFPGDDAYWRQLAGIYMTLNDHARALSVLELAWRRGAVTTEQDLLQFARLYLYQDIPFKAARLLEDGIGSGQIEAGTGNRELLASAWALARERQQAIRAYRAAAQSGNNAEVDFALAQLYLEDERWDEAAVSLETALAKTGLRNPGNAWLLLGIARYELKASGSARAAFERAAGYEASRGTARQWLAHLEQQSGIP